MKYQYFSVEPPPGAGSPFTARVDENGSVTSNRNGNWETETVLEEADLWRPEQERIEWDIRPINDPNVTDSNPNHDPKNGQFTTGTYKGATESRRGGKKKRMEHAVFAHSKEEASKIMIERHRDDNKLQPSDYIASSDVRIQPNNEPAPRSKYPNKGSKEYEALQEMQRRYDELQHKGD